MVLNRVQVAPNVWQVVDTSKPVYPQLSPNTKLLMQRNPLNPITGGTKRHLRNLLNLEFPPEVKTGVPVRGGGTFSLSNLRSLRLLSGGGGGQASPLSFPSIPGSGRRIPFIPDAQPLALPKPSPLPTLTLPERDEDRIGELAQKAAAPGMRMLRGGLQRGLLSSRDENPNVEAIKQGEILKNFGIGVSQIMSASHMVALEQYNQEFGDLMFKAKAEYVAKLDDRSAQFQAQVQGAFATFNASVTTRESALGRLMSAETQRSSQAFSAAMAEYNAAAQAQRDSIDFARNLQKMKFGAILDVLTFGAKKQIS